MNRFLFTLLLKSALALLIVLFQLPVFATNYYSDGGGPFHSTSTWSINQTTSKPPLTIDFTDRSNNFFIRNGDAVTVTSTSGVSLNNLTITGGLRGALSSLTFAIALKSPFVINGDLSIESGVLDFGTANVSVTVMGNLIKGISSNSTIKQSPLAPSSQKLILNGPSNEVEFYMPSTSTKAGKMEVIYSSDSKQQLFGASANSINAYSTLTISGRGPKILNTDVTVSTALNISGTYIELNENLLNYAGEEAKLITNKGWVYTNNSKGAYRNTNTNITETTKTFPVGTAAAMQKITLTDINTSKGSPEIAMYFADNGGPSFTSGMGSWRFTASVATNFNVTLYPESGAITSASSIATAAPTSAWKVEPTTYASADNSYSSAAPFTLSSGTTWFMLFNCPTYAITPTSIPLSYAGDLFNDIQFLVNSNAALARDLQIDKTLKDFLFTGGVLKCANTSLKPPVQKTPFTLTYTDGNNCSVSNNYSIVILNRASPNLSIANIDTKTFGEDSFQVHTFSRSRGKITYSVSSSGTGVCATINDTTGFVKITCGGPFPNNQITVTATQASDGVYKAESVSKSFIINPANGRIFIKNFAFLANNTTTGIKVATKSKPATLSFEQLSGFNVARVDDIDGKISNILQPGQFTVHISLAATNDYTAFDSVYTFNVYTLNKPPVAIGDTITLEMGTDTTFNILQNDRGQTGEIIPNNTDIDIENSGVQFRYYATELGNFIIDTAGNLTVRPFYGFIGSGRMGYTVTDLNGLTSEVAYVEVTVKAPYVTPELKANDVMTPNNDNLNDALVIGNTDLSKENSLIIIDVAGNTVYESTNYQNNWEGTDKKGNKLEPGTYFYTFKEKTSGRELENYIQIVK